MPATSHSLRRGWHRLVRDVATSLSDVGGPARAGEWALVVARHAFLLPHPTRHDETHQGSVDAGPAGAPGFRSWRVLVATVLAVALPAPFRHESGMHTLGVAGRIRCVERRRGSSRERGRRRRRP